MTDYLKTKTPAIVLSAALMLLTSSANAAQTPKNPNELRGEVTKVANNCTSIADRTYDTYACIFGWAEDEDNVCLANKFSKDPKKENLCKKLDAALQGFTFEEFEKGMKMLETHVKTESTAINREISLYAPKETFPDLLKRITPKINELSKNCEEYEEQIHEETTALADVYAGFKSKECHDKF